MITAADCWAEAEEAADRVMETAEPFRGGLRARAGECEIRMRDYDIVNEIIDPAIAAIDRHCSDKMLTLEEWTDLSEFLKSARSALVQGRRFDP